MLISGRTGDSDMEKQFALILSVILNKSIELDYSRLCRAGYKTRNIPWLRQILLITYSKKRSGTLTAPVAKIWFLHQKIETHRELEQDELSKSIAHSATT